MWRVPSLSLALNPDQSIAHNDGRQSCFSVHGPNFSMALPTSSMHQGREPRTHSCWFFPSPLFRKSLPSIKALKAHILLWNLPVQTQPKWTTLSKTPLNHLFHISRTSCKHRRKPRFGEVKSIFKATQLMHYESGSFVFPACEPRVHPTWHATSLTFSVEGQEPVLT